uniref:Uncharacterized protein n=1 Tax=Variovorax paradoxus (strain S110) TaxID=543728 RepID=C5CJP8_VARPS
MSGVNSLPSERLAVAAVVAPGARAAGAGNSGWVDTALYSRLMGVISTGTLGASATVDAKWQSATDSSGTGAADIAAGQPTQIVKATGDNKQVVMNLDVNRLPDRTKRFVRLVLTVGTATSDAGAIVFGVDPRHGPASDNDATTVAQVVSN